MNFLKPKFWDVPKISFLATLLRPVAFLLKLLFFFKKFIVYSHKSSIPVICVGNIYLGGTGKTPLCIEIFSILKELNMNPAFIRKRYDSFRDEVYLQKAIGPVYENKKRINAIKEAEQNNSNIVILDDGFQDFSIKKEFSIICFNGKQLTGNGLTIPSGPLRENLSSLKRANCVVINGKKNINFENKIFNKNKDIKIFYTKYIPQNINEFKNKKVVAFAGIGNPDNFFNLLEEYKIDIFKKIKFPDHYEYSNKELEDLKSHLDLSNTILLTTEKDYVRIDQENKKNINFLKIKLEIENRHHFINEIKKTYENY